MHTTVIVPSRMQFRHTFRWRHAAMLVMMLILCGCGATPQNLSFTTITSMNDFTPLGGYEKEAPALVVIANPQDLINPGLGVHFASGLGDPLRALDYSHQFAVLVLQGLKGSGGYRVNAQQVSRRGNRVTVQAEFIEPGPGEGQTLGFTSPHQLIVVTKDPAWEPVNRFELLVDGTVVATATHSIP